MSKTVRNQTPAQRKQCQRFMSKQYRRIFDPTIEAFFDQWLGQSNRRVPCLVCDQQPVQQAHEQRRRNFYARV